MKIKTQELVEALEIVKPGLARKEVIEQTTSFAFLNGKIVTYNDEFSISHPLDGVEFEGAILAENLYQLLKKMKMEEIEVDVDNSNIVFQAGRIKAGLVMQSEIKLPLEEIEKPKDWVSLPKDFSKFIALSVTSCSKDMSKPVLTAIHVNKEGYMEASDSYRITRCQFDGELQDIETFLLPATSAVEVMKINPTEISQSESWVHFRNEIGTIFSCRILEGDYPNASRVLNTSGRKIVFPKRLRESMERANIFAKRDHILEESVRMEFKKKSLIVSADSPNGWYEERLNIRYDGDEFTIIISPFLLKGILEEINECEVSDRFIKFEGENWIYVAALMI